MKIKDLQGGYTFEYGGCHDSLRISEDGRSLSYYNLQNGDGSRFGDYRFVMEDGEVPQDSESVCAYYGDCYFNIGGFPNVEQIRADAERDFQNSDYWNDYLAQIIADTKSEAIDECIHKLNEYASIPQLTSAISFLIGGLEQLKEQKNIE